MTDIMQEGRQDHLFVISLFLGQLSGLYHVLQLGNFFAGVFRSAMFFIKAYYLVGDLLGLRCGHLTVLVLGVRYRK